MTKHIKGKGLWAWAGIAALLAAIVLFSTQAFATGITVTADPVNLPSVTYPKVYQAEWGAVSNGAQAKIVTLDVSAGSVTTVTAFVTFSAGGSRLLKIQLLDSSATIVSQGCASVAKNVSTTIDVIPDVTFSTVNRVNALAVAAC